MNNVKVDYSNKVALVTGGGSGIGRALCLEFAMAGARVACVDIKPDLGGETVAQIKEAGGDAILLTADVSDKGSVQKYVENTVASFGRIDAFVNNAGYEGVFQPINEYSEEMYERVMSINIKGVFLGLKYVLPVMMKQKSGSVVNIASRGSFVGVPGLSVYAASKHAVMGLTRSVALEVARQGIRVNAVCPGATNTPMLRSAEKMSYSTVSIPDGRCAEPVEIAQAVLFLASDLASHITGQSLVVDGGVLAG
jgi:3alpha(or 20beta)-hydroxysteroid dehydrogenase